MQLKPRVAEAMMRIVANSGIYSTEHRQGAPCREASVLIYVKSEDSCRPKNVTVVECVRTGSLNRLCRRSETRLEQISLHLLDG